MLTEQQILNIIHGGGQFQSAQQILNAVYEAGAYTGNVTHLTGGDDLQLAVAAAAIRYAADSVAQLIKCAPGVVDNRTGVQPVGVYVDFEIIAAKTQVNTSYVAPGDNLQAAVDAAVAAGAAYDNPYEIHHSGVDNTVNRNAYTGKILTTAGAPALGVILVDSIVNNAPDVLEPIHIYGIPIAIIADDGYAAWATEEPGYLLQACDAVGGATGWDAFPGPNGIAVSANAGALWSNGQSIMFYDSTTIGSAAAVIATTKILNVAGNGYGTVDFSPYNCLNFGFRTFTQAPSSLEIGVCTEATFNAATAIWTNFPTVTVAEYYRGIIQLPAEMKISGIQTIGIRAAYAAGSQFRLYIDNIKLTALGEAGVRNVGAYGTYAAIPANNSLVPCAFAAKRGIPMTHMLAYSILGGAGILTNDQIRYLANICGNSIQVHAWDHDVTPTTYGGWYRHTAGMLDYLERLTATRDAAQDPAAFLGEIGLRVTGYKQSGGMTGDGNIDTLAKTLKAPAFALRRAFRWAMSYVDYATPNRRWFGKNTWNDDSTFTSSPESSGVMTLHNIVAVAAGLYISYTAFRTVIEQLAGYQAAGKIRCMTLPAYFAAKQLPGNTPATVLALAPSGAMDKITTANILGNWVENWGWRSAVTSVQGATPDKYLRLGDGTVTTQQSIYYSTLEFTPGEPFSLVFNVTGNAVSVLEIGVNYNKEGGVNSVYQTVVNCIPGSSPEDIYVILNPPVWCSEVRLFIFRLAGSAGNITINKVRCLPRT